MEHREASAVRGGADLVGGAVRLQRLLPSSVEWTWEALTHPEHTVTWLGRLVGGPLRAGCEVEVWHDEDVRSLHTVVDSAPPHVLHLTWDFPGEPPSAVRFTLTAAGDRTTRLDLRHEGLEDPVSYAAGWHRHLEYLDAHLRGQDRPLGEFWTGYDDLVAQYHDEATRSAG